MRFALPVTEAEDIQPLLEAGAAEFYCGYLDGEWACRWGDHDSASRRQGTANVADRQSLCQIAATAGQAGAPIWLALNSCYSPPQYPYLLALAKDWAKAGGSGLILRDLALLRQVKALVPPLRLSLSLLAVGANSAALRFFQSLGADRVVLPRFLSPARLQPMLAQVPGLEYEAMVLDDGCPLIDGYCRGIHGMGYACRDDGAPATLTIASHDISGSGHHLCQELGRKPNEPPACAACSLPALAAAGISVGKFGGRGLPLAARLEKLDFLRSALALATDSQRRDLYQSRFGPCNCYYPPAAAERQALT